MSKTIKLLITILLVALLSMTFVPNMAMASGSGSGSGASTGTTSDYDSTIDTLFAQQASGTDGITTTGGKIVDVITTVGIIVAVIVLLILGIKYMMGSASEKAEYKKTMIPYLVGAVLIFGASAIAKAVVNMTAGITG